MFAYLSILLTTVLVNDTCVAPAQTATAPLERSAGKLYRKRKPDDAAKAAELWLKAAHLYPVCEKTFGRRLDNVVRALNALKLATKSSGSCEDPELRTAALTRTSLYEISTIYPAAGGSVPGSIEEMRAELKSRLDALPESAREVAEFIDPRAPRGPMETSLAAHDLAVTTYGNCPEFRVALARHASPVDTLPPPPSCDAASENARAFALAALAAMIRVDTEAAQTLEYSELSRHLDKLEDVGDTIGAARVEAEKVTGFDSRAQAWSTIARSLPACAAYLSEKHEAVVTAITAWRQASGYLAFTSDRHKLAIELLDDTLRELENEYGERAKALPQYESLIDQRDVLGPSPAAPGAVSTEPRSIEPSRLPQEEKWIRRLRPEHNMIELGLIGGVEFASEVHQLFDPYAQRDSPGGNSFWKPYRRVNSQFGLRFGWFPLRFIGGELEGGIVPSKILIDGAPTERAVLFNFRAHLIGQLPFWRIAPFVLVGGGLIGTSGALGKDVDPSLNLGGGVKLYVTKRFMMRVDFREVRAARLGIDAGGTNYPEVNVGFSLTLNRARASNKDRLDAKAGKNARK